MPALHLHFFLWWFFFSFIRYSGVPPSNLGNNTKLVDWMPQNDLLGEHIKKTPLNLHFTQDWSQCRCISKCNVTDCLILAPKKWLLQLNHIQIQPSNKCASGNFGRYCLVNRILRLIEDCLLDTDGCAWLTFCSPDVLKFLGLHQVRLSEFLRTCFETYLDPWCFV